MKNIENYYFNLRRGGGCRLHTDGVYSGHPLVGYSQGAPAFMRISEMVGRIDCV